jgi:nicotinamide-nucleotide amidase
MRNGLILLYIGDFPCDLEILRGYVEREARRRGWNILRESVLPAFDTELPLELQRELEERTRHLIVASAEAFPLVGRILSTLSGRPLTLEAGEVLAPSGALAPHPYGYTFSFDGRELTVLRSDEERPFPSLLLEERGALCRQWFPRDAAEEAWLLRELRPFIGEFVELRRLLPGWYRLCAAGEEGIARLELILRGRRLRLLPGRNVVEALIRYLGKRGRTLTFAESCTGGRLAAAITSEPGASAILEGSWVTYANRIKEGWLGVRAETLERHGAVSEACVREMASGARRRIGADIALAVSGIAGPTGAVPGKPVGTVWFCLRNGETERTRRVRFHGDRNAVQEQAVLHGLKMIVESEEKIFDFFSENS